MTADPNRSRIALLLLLAASRPAHAVDIQLFGDVYLPARVLVETHTSPEAPSLFAGVDELLRVAQYNVVNLEGVITTAFVPHEAKRYLLRMPLVAARVLRNAGVTAATLANNHSMDFGPQGLFDTRLALEAAGIAHTGAGADRDLATRPLILAAGNRVYCLLAFSRTLPESFWADVGRPGTAPAEGDAVDAAVDGCVAQGLRPIVTFHWGQEGATHSLAYQRALARRAVDRGAVLVAGHHPHVTQEIEFYRGRPIVYSLGNFAFGTDPRPATANGLVVGFTTSDDGRATTLTLTPLKVQNDVVKFKPRLHLPDEPDPVPALLPKEHPCRADPSRRRWVCALDDRKS